MRSMKVAGVLAAAVVALSVIAAPVSATTITSPAGTVATPVVKAESEGHVVFANPIASINCWSQFQGSVVSHGSGVTAQISLGGMSFTLCTNSWHMTLVSPGDLEIHWTSGVNGTVTSSGMTIDATRLGVTCMYKTDSTHVGTITGGNPATIHIDAGIPVHGGSGLCGSGIHQWEGSYVVTSPSSLYVDS